MTKKITAWTIMAWDKERPLIDTGCRHIGPRYMTFRTRSEANEYWSRAEDIVPITLIVPTRPFKPKRKTPK
ncbi:MAG TPA: hypothetical protein VOA88_15790 [Candidatus Dormibacteraeota bacterium]|nr:hypothetical protein [Candidatus Dormibacteraeota bacterium]